MDSVDFTFNHRPVRLTVDSDRTLLRVLRSDFGLTGAKFDCGIGACTVLLNQEAVRSCQIPITDVKGKQALTIESLTKTRALYPLQEAFVEHDAVQCGFCTPGMILTAYSLLLQELAPTDAEIIAGMDDNLCRCGGYQRMVAAITTAAGQMRG